MRPAAALGMSLSFLGCRGSTLCPGGMFLYLIKAVLRAPLLLMTGGNDSKKRAKAMPALMVLTALCGGATASACTTVILSGTGIQHKMGAYELQANKTSSGRPAYYSTSTHYWMYSSGTSWYVGSELGGDRAGAHTQYDVAQTPDAITAQWVVWNGTVWADDPSVKAACCPATCCPVGYFGAACFPCPAGKFARTRGSAMCATCPAGQASVVASKSCYVPCEAGSAPGFVWQASGTCSVPVASLAECEAATDFLGLRNVNVSSGAYAGNYPPGCFGHHTSDAQGRSAVRALKFNNWTSSAPCSGTARCICVGCVPCLSGQHAATAGLANCSGVACAAGSFGKVGQTTGAAASCAPCTAGRYTSSRGREMCAGVCPDKSWCDLAGQCIAGRQDEGCTECALGYAMRAKGACVPCAASRVRIAISWTVLLAVGVWFFRFMRKATKKAAESVQTSAKRAKGVKEALQNGFDLVTQVAALFSIVTYLQTAGRIVQMEFNWPPPLSNAIAAMSEIIDFDVIAMSSPECVIGRVTFFQRWLLTTIGVPILAFVLTLSVTAVYCIGHKATFDDDSDASAPQNPNAKKERRKEREQKACEQKAFGTVSTLFMLLFVGVATSAAKPFDCVDYDGTGVRVMRSYPTIECIRDVNVNRTVGYLGIYDWDVSFVHNSHASWTQFELVAFPTLLLCVGIVTFLWFVLWSEKSRLGQKRTMDRLGGLYLRYDEKYWFWETVIFARKFGVVLLSSVLSDHPWWQVCGSAVLFGGSLVAQVRCAPYRSDSMDRIEVVALSSCVALVALGACTLAGLHSVAVSVGFCLVAVVTIVKMFDPACSIWAGADDAIGEPVHTEAAPTSKPSANPVSTQLAAKGTERENPEFVVCGAQQIRVLEKGVI